MSSKNTVMYNFSDNINNVSLITGISIIIVVIVFFLPIISPLFVTIGKIVSLFLLVYAFLLNLKTTNKAMSNLNNLFVDPSKSSVRDVMIISYIFSISIIVLIVVIINSFFR